MLGLREEGVTQAEVAASIAYCAMQQYYARLVSIELKRMKAVLFIVAIGYMWWRFVRYNGLSPAVFLKSQRG